MANEQGPVQFADPASLFLQEHSPWDAPKLTRGVPDPQRSPGSATNGRPSTDERIESIRTSGIMNHLLPAEKIQVYKCTDEAISWYKQRKEEYLASKKRPAPPPAKPQQQDPLPVDAETLASVKPKEPPTEPEQPPKRQKTEQPAEVAVEQLPPKPEEPDSSSSGVSLGSGIVSDDEDREPSQQADESAAASLDDDVAYLTKQNASADSNPRREKAERSSSSSSSDEAKPLDKRSASSSDDMVLKSSEKNSSSEDSSSSSEERPVKASSSEDDSAPSRSDKQVASSDADSSSSGSADADASVVDESSSSVDSEEDDDDEEEEAPLNVRRGSDRKRKPTQRYNDEDFPDEEPKKSKKAAGKPVAITVNRSQLQTRTNLAVGNLPASKIRNNVTTEAPPAFPTISTIDRMKHCGKHLTQLYTTGWCKLVDRCIEMACVLEFKDANLPVTTPPKPTVPTLIAFLSEMYTKHLFEKQDLSQFPPDSHRAKMLKIQRLFFVYGSIDMAEVENGWSHIQLWEPHDWALDRGYALRTDVHVKTEHLKAYSALRTALYPNEYVIYRARIAVAKAMEAARGAPSQEEIVARVKSNPYLKEGLCNDWIVTCQLTGLDILGAWSSYDLDIKNYVC